MENTQSKTPKSDRHSLIWQAVQKAEMSQIGGGGSIRAFSDLTGIRTTDNRIDARLWQGYRQFANPTADGGKQEEWQSDSGEYP